MLRHATLGVARCRGVDAAGLASVAELQPLTLLDHSSSFSIVRVMPTNDTKESLLNCNVMYQKQLIDVRGF